MFVTSDQQKTPRVFQKPNILRRKPKCKEKMTPEPAALEEEKADAGMGAEGKHQCSKSAHSGRKPSRITLDTYVCEEYRQRKLRTLKDASHQQDVPKLWSLKNQVNGTYKEGENINVQIVLTSNHLEEEFGLKLPTEPSGDQQAVYSEYVNYTIVNSEAHKRIGEFTIQLAPHFTFDSLEQLNLLQHASDERKPSMADRQDTSRIGQDLDTIAVSAEPASECAQLPCPSSVVLTDPPFTGKANQLESIQSAPAPAVGRHVMLDCPARCTGEEFLCDAVFQSREHLVKHLKEQHTVDDAVYKCDTCQRTFFWCSGLRAHMRVHDKSSRTIYACLWPDCSRVFLQACRLKEHSRQHTGDKPYPCLYPKCGWAFRTASKLVRHARRHTDERRFPCRLCQRAFLRAEHLREHEARHTNLHGRHKHECTHPGCGQRFSNKSSLYLHTKKMHAPPLPPPPPPPPPRSPTPFVNQPEIQAPEPMATAQDECRAARTHVTWPIAPGAHANSADTGSDSDVPVYPLVRSYSDLFLHGDAILQHEDSQQCLETGLELVLLAGGGGAGGGYPPDALHLDSDLGLLDSPADPINHLLQEELMLAAESCVDESPFQVLLLSEDDGQHLH